MSAPFEVKLDVGPALNALQNTAAKLGNLSPVHRAIGELLVDSTKQRFADSQAPDGSTWQTLSETTLQIYIKGWGKNDRSRFGASNFKKGGDLNARGTARLNELRKPLIGKSKDLSTQIFYEVSANGNELTVGSPMVYAAVQQFGQKKGASGSTKNGRPIPLGDIPPRPFIGLSTDDLAMMQRQYSDYIGNFTQAP